MAIYLDIRKAFNTVNHCILIKKLKTSGIRGNMRDWFKSYLTDRRRVTKINGVISNETNS